MSYDNKLDARFPAVLKTVDNKELEFGNITVSREDRSVDFTNNFVPLCKLGDHMKIVRLQDDVEVISYTGEVYLSSQNVLRIVDVTEEFLSGAYTALLYEVNLIGQVEAEIMETPPKKKFSLFHKKPAPIHATFPVNIHALSMQYICFTTEQTLQKEQNIYLDLENPALSHVQLKVEQSVNMGQEQNTYKCAVRLIDAGSKNNLIDYIKTLITKTDVRFR